MKLKKLSTLCLAASTLFAASSAMAWESEDGQHSTSASVALSTDYMWRGYSQTDNDMAISGSFDYAHASGFYAGTWASNVDFEFDADASTEIDVYAGFASEFGESGVGYDVSVLRYLYPSANGLDWTEFTLGLSYSIFSASVSYSDDVYGSDEDGIYYNLSASYDLPAGFAVSAAVGYYDYDDAISSDGQTDYSIGISKELAGFGFDLSYIGMDSDGKSFNTTASGTELADGRFVFTISKSM
jgi:uncharacterized protein (TIGR02001 family)